VVPKTENPKLEIRNPKNPNPNSTVNNDLNFRISKFDIRIYLTSLSPPLSRCGYLCGFAQSKKCLRDFIKQKASFFDQ
jgi:hypothetical protein